MIIKRKFATYGQLTQDQYSRRTILDIFEKYNVSDKVKQYILDPNNDVIVHNTDMGSGIPGQAYQELRSELDELDITYPFDNGLTYRDVTETVVLPSKKGTAVMQILYCRRAERPSLIVQVVAFEYKDGRTTIIEPWDTGSLIL